VGEFTEERERVGITDRFYSDDIELNILMAKERQSNLGIVSKGSGLKCADTPCDLHCDIEQRMECGEKDWECKAFIRYSNSGHYRHDDVGIHGRKRRSNLE
jgi:hypothetical protein